MSDSSTNSLFNIKKSTRSYAPRQEKIFYGLFRRAGFRHLLFELFDLDFGIAHKVNQTDPKSKDFDGSFGVFI
jgi:hypothetical protein